MSWTYEEREEYERNFIVATKWNQDLQNKLDESGSCPQIYSYTSEIKDDKLVVKCVLNEDSYYVETDFFCCTWKIGKITAKLVNDKSGLYVYFGALYVTDSINVRGKGIATTLVSRIFNEAKILWPNIDFVVNCNDLSRSIFEKAGFKFQETIHIMKVCKNKYDIR